MARKENIPEPLRILIAENDTVIAMDLREALESLGHRVIGEAPTGVEALRLARELKPDLLLGFHGKPPVVRSTHTLVCRL